MTATVNGLRIRVVIAVLIAEIAHLAWEHFHGGVVTHHFLARDDLPEFSNWWGLLLLPALAWFCVARTQRRLQLASADASTVTKGRHGAVVGFVAALTMGITLSIAFASGNQSAPLYVLQASLLLAVLLPAYRAECFLGFVLGMTFTFGAVLPMVIGGVIAALSALCHLLIYPMSMRLLRWFRKRLSGARA
jgi:hypothetical protein